METDELVSLDHCNMKGLSIEGSKAEKEIKQS